MGPTRIHLQSDALPTATWCGAHLRSDTSARTHDPAKVTCKNCRRILDRINDPHIDMISNATRQAKATARGRAQSKLRQMHPRQYDALVQIEYRRLYPKCLALEHQKNGLGQGGWCPDCGAKC